jgi:putative flavoprotein involved in K+ transport
MVTKTGPGKRGAAESEVIILGGGPAGLCLGAHLRHRGVPCRILEKGNPGDSWRRMPPGLSLVSPWKTNWLMPDDAHHYPGNAQLTRREYADYLREFAASNDLRIESNTEVHSVRRGDHGFELETSLGTLCSRIVVNATGYFANPIRPSIRGSEATDIPQLHYADYRGPEQIAKLAPRGSVILIVGQRLSAGQTVLELNATGWKVALSHRTPLQFGCSDWLWPIAYRNFPWIEEIKLRLRPNAGALNVRMPGGRLRRLITSGSIPTFSQIERVNPRSVTFCDGREFTPGLILYATGFRPALQHLQSLNLRSCAESGLPFTRETESVDVPGLYFLGLEKVRNFQSRFLRGIRNDAAHLASVIARRLARKDSPARELMPA